MYLFENVGVIRGHLRDSHVECVSFGDLMKVQETHITVFLWLCTLLSSGFTSKCYETYLITYEIICEKMKCDVSLLNESMDFHIKFT